MLEHYERTERALYPGNDNDDGGDGGSEAQLAKLSPDDGIPHPISTH